MKRRLLFALLISAALALPVTASRAQQMEPGCNPVMWGYLEDQADAMRARNKAYERELLHRQQSTLYLTCFDQAMAVSARLGYIFSDVIPPNPPPANTVVFDDGAGGTKPPGAGAAPGTVAYPDWGATHTLAIDLDTVVNPEFNNWLDAVVPAPGLFNFLPQWMPANNQLTPIATAQKAIIVEINTFQTTIDADNGPLSGCVLPPAIGAYSDEKDYIALVMEIDALVKALPTVTLTGLPPQNTLYNADIVILDCLVAAIEADRKGVMPAYLTALRQAVFGVAITCTRMDDLWVKLDPAYVVTDVGVFYPPEGKYYLFSPYYTLQDFLNVPPSPPATPDFVQELGNATDAAALKQALADLTGPLDAAGNSPVWPAPPVFQPNSDAQTVINQM